MSLTVNRSYDDVFNETQGGNLDGWRYATAAEYIGLADAAGIPASFLDNEPGGTHAGFALLNGFLGSGSNAGESLSISAESFNPGFHAIGGFSSDQTFFEVPDNNQFVYTPNYANGRTDTQLGSALVRVVPLPPAAWLLGTGLLGLFGVARRKKAI